MASIFAHGLVAAAVGKVMPKIYRRPKFYILGVLCAMFPDADVLGFQFGIAYSDFLGHRGFSHSLVFALIMAILIQRIFYKKVDFRSKAGITLIFYFFICMASHGVLDAFTTGGLGVAFFAPFDNSRYFFPFRVIQVSPIGVKAFFTETGIKVLISEYLWIGIPCFFVFILSFFSYFVKKYTPR
ncbi:metal-dependent hydrolase [Flexithrix dorotheae]|uniref:metal-dependent hydrolase n=1 Tax=Flexithrix dorotheae TaxID=70993 RepID=UPI000370A767|nr:metal-dependent hydrolase [Flexithrix dorotheae]